MRRFFRELSGGNTWLNILGGIIIGLVGNYLFDLLRQDIFWGIIIIVVIIILSYVIYIILSKKPHLDIDSGENIPKTPHIISGLSFLNHRLTQEDIKGKDSNIRLIINLIEKHQPILQQLHLVTSSTSGVLESRAELSRWIEQQKNNPEEIVKDILISDGHDMGEVFRAVNKYLRELKEQGIDLKTQVLIDVTAGTAAISAGLTMAALSNGCNLTYQSTQRKEGDNLTGLISWQFYTNRIVQVWEEYFPNERQ